jgi:hypothetical protein
MVLPIYLNPGATGRCWGIVPGRVLFVKNSRYLPGKP